MARKRITYGESYLLASQPPSNSDNLTNLSGLKRIQSVDIGWDFERKRFTQVGSPDFVEDTHLRNPNITIGVNYYYSNGTNEAVLGLDVDGANRGVLNFLGLTGQDRNLYLLIGSGSNDEPLNQTNYNGNYGVMSFGNCFMNSYRLSASLGNPISVSTSLSSYNFKLDDYTDNGNVGNIGVGIPAIDTSVGEPTRDGHQFRVSSDNLVNTSNLDGLIDPALGPNYIEMTLPTLNIPGVQLYDEETAPISSMNVAFNIRRIDNYGFGSLYPYGRKTILPLLGTLNFSTTTNEFRNGALHSMITSGESTFDFTFNFKNCSGATGLQIEIEGAKLDRQGQKIGIGGNAETDLEFTFSMSNTSGMKMSTPPLFLENVSGNVAGPASGPVSVTATGKTPITYQWYKDEVAIGGATSSSYGVFANGSYYVIATNELGTGKSRACVGSSY